MYALLQAEVNVPEKKKKEHLHDNDLGFRNNFPEEVMLHLRPKR